MCSKEARVNQILVTQNLIIILSHSFKFHAEG